MKIQMWNRILKLGKLVFNVISVISVSNVFSFSFFLILNPSSLLTRHSILWNLDLKNSCMCVLVCEGQSLSRCCPAVWPQIEQQETSASYHPELTGVLVWRICDVNSELHLLTSLTGLVSHTTHSHSHSLQPPPPMKLWASGIQSNTAKTCKGMYFLFFLFFF